MKRLQPAPFLWLALACGAGTCCWGGEGSPSFEEHVRPILKAHCFACHGEAGLREGELDVRLQRLLVAGGESGPAIVPSDRTSSLLFARIEAEEMPPGDVKLSPGDVKLIGRWIDSGAPTLRPEPVEVNDGYLFTQEERDYWAFQPVQPIAVPTVSSADQVRTPADAFLLSQLVPLGLSFAPEADKVTLLRRACFDLLGLPPTLEQVRTFLADDAEDAYERLLDRLLASPHYGERWGRHWLDAAGYADSEGYTADDPVRTNAYKYRDYVIRSINADKPLDQFIQEQLAGDEMVEPPYENLASAEIDLLTATGFLRMAPDGTGSGSADQNLARNQVLADTIRIVTTSLLGLTVGCAECHDHRYDPIPQEDYYRLRAIFEPAYDWKNWRSPKQRLVSLYSDADRAESKRIEEEAVALEKQRQTKQQEFIDRTLALELDKIDPKPREEIRVALKTPADKRTPVQEELLRKHPSTNVTAGSLYLYDKKAADELKKMADDVKAIRDKKPVEEFIRCLTEAAGNIPETCVFIRGDHEQPGKIVRPAALTITSQSHSAEIPENDPELPMTGRRLAYARYLTNGRHPLTARVLVNRIWMHHFGRGIVETPGDFGSLGARPTHPELLDWLAGELVAGGWRLKPLHKQLMTSAAYRQSSQATPQSGAADAQNKLYSHWSVRRIEAESIRDAIILLSGKMEPEMFGPPVPIREDEVGQVVVGIDTTDSAGRPTGEIIPLNGQEFRRSIYVSVRRSQPLAVLNTFDAPIMDPNCNRRTASTVTPQALMLLNSPFIHALSHHFAQRVWRDADPEFKARVDLAWQLAYSRPPSDSQMQEATAFLEAMTEHFRKTTAEEENSEKNAAATDDPALRALTSFCQALLSSNQFLYVD